MDEKSELVKENRWKTFHTELLAQYKLYVETAEKVSEKRQNSNNFYLALNSSLFTLLGYLATVLDGLWIIILPIMGISISFVWRQNINSFSQLNSAKYDVIHKLEEYLPASLFKTEWYEYLKKPRVVVKGKDGMKGAYLGPSFTDDEIKKFLDNKKAAAAFFPDKELFDQVAGHLENGAVVGWFQGRMEFGPRALGGRSILGDARNKEMQSKMNLKIKYRESFRPFAPSVLVEKAEEYFELDGHASPYMLLTAFVKQSRRREMTKEEQELWGIEKLNATRSDLPAITHVDYSARVQTVSADVSPRYHALLKQFESRTGCAVLVNTSFNVRGEPIVCTPEDAYRCFMRTDMDVLVLGNYVLEKTKQPKFEDSEDWGQVYTLD